MEIVRGDHLIDAVWARDSSTLWHALKRQSKKSKRYSRAIWDY